MGDWATMSNSQPRAATIRRGVDIFMSGWLSNLDRLGCLMPNPAAT